ncbi:MAG: hypothetical protein IPN94_25745 [Sphingobacteriales bacterium]|nr:hypothetical protein [Sphingobacteriales bacterium]
MLNTQLVTLLKSFSTAELAQLRLFVQSPFFTTLKDMPLLLDFITNLIEQEKQKTPVDTENETPKQKLQRLEAEQQANEQHYIDAYNYLNPQKATSTPKEVITKKNAELLKLAEQFIEHNYLKKEICNRKYAANILLEHCLVHGLKDKFKNEYKKVEAERAEITTKNAHYHFKSFELAEILGAYNSRFEDKYMRDELKLALINEELDTFYLAEKLEYLCHCRNRMRAVNFKYELNLEKELLNYLPQSPYLQKTVVKIWYDTLMLLIDPTNQALHTQLKNSIVDATNCLIGSEKNTIFAILVNSINQAYPIGPYSPTDRYVQYFNIYKLQSENPDALYLEGNLDLKTFRNIGIAAMRLNELDWAAEFIHEHKAKILNGNNDSEDTYYLLLAEISLSKKEYENARDFLLKIKGENVGLKIDERRVSLKVYYELNEGLFDVTVINFKKFLKLNTDIIEDNYRIQNQNCINFAKTLSKIKNEEIRWGETTKYPMAFLNDLEAEIKNEPMVSDRFWLLEKLEGLKTAQTLKNNRPR